jgi:hypothetical protein
MAEMHQIVVLTTHEVSKAGLMAIYKAASEHSARNLGPDEFSSGTAFKLRDKVTIPDDEQSGMPAIGPQNIEPIYGPLAL